MGRLIERVRAFGVSAVALCDSDESGREALALCQKRGIVGLEVGALISVTEDASIEDVIGLEMYVKAVNDFYSSFDWFAELEAQEAERQGRSLGKWISSTFVASFAGRTLDKIAITAFLAATMQAGDLDLARKFRGILKPLISSLPS